MKHGERITIEVNYAKAQDIYLSSHVSPSISSPLTFIVGNERLELTPAIARTLGLNLVEWADDAERLESTT